MCLLKSKRNLNPDLFSIPNVIFVISLNEIKTLFKRNYVAGVPCVYNSSK